MALAEQGVGSSLTPTALPPAETLLLRATGHVFGTDTPQGPGLFSEPPNNCDSVVSGQWHQVAQFLGQREPPERLGLGQSREPADLRAARWVLSRAAGHSPRSTAEETGRGSCAAELAHGRDGERGVTGGC